MNDTGYDINVLYDATSADEPIRSVKSPLRRLPMMEPKMNRMKSISIPLSPGR